MSDVKLMKPLFHGDKFNREGHRIKAVFVREISNGIDAYRLWQRIGKADMSYPQAENDKYLLYLEINGYLASLRMTEFDLINNSGYPPAIRNLYGGREQRNEYFGKLSRADARSVSAALDRERAEVQRCGSDPAHQANYIKAQLDEHIATYLTAKENGGKSFPDFTGALVLNELSVCAELRSSYNEVLRHRRETRLAERRREDEELVQSGNAKAEQEVQAALDIIRHGGALENRRITLYTLTPDDYTSAEYSIVNYLMRRFKVNIPLRTQGWVNDRLSEAKIADGKCVSVRYLRSKRGQVSEKFYQCMDELIRAVCKEKVTNGPGT